MVTTAISATVKRRVIRVVLLTVPKFSGQRNESERCVPMQPDPNDELKRLRAAGDALYELISVRLVIPADQHDDAVEQIRKWKEARRG